LDTLRHAAAMKQVSLAYIEPTTNVYVEGDAARLRQVIWNVLSNAVKFSPVGARVEVTLRQSDSVLMSVAFGMAREELSVREFDALDKSYPAIVAIRAVRDPPSPL